MRQRHEGVHRSLSQPPVPIDVDPETGIWRTDGLPMACAAGGHAECRFELRCEVVGWRR
jgi:hypothetical protein